MAVRTLSLKLIVTLAGSNKNKTLSFGTAATLGKHLATLGPFVAVEGETALVSETARYSLVGLTLADIGTVTEVDGKATWTPSTPVKAPKAAAVPPAVVPEPAVVLPPATIEDAGLRKQLVKGWKSLKERAAIADRIEAFLEHGYLAALEGTKYHARAVAAVAS